MANTMIQASIAYVETEILLAVMDGDEKRIEELLLELGVDGNAAIEEYIAVLKTALTRTENFLRTLQNPA